MMITITIASVAIAALLLMKMFRLRFTVSQPAPATAAATDDGASPAVRRRVHFGSDQVKLYDPKDVPNAELTESPPVVVAVPLTVARPSILRRRRSSSAAAPADPPVIDLSINVGEKVRHVVVPL